MFCTHCGSQVADGSKFCYKCGANMKPAAPVEQVVEPVVEQVVEQPVVEQVIEPVVEQYVEPAVEQYVEPVVEQVAEPVVEQYVEPAVEQVIEQPVVEQYVEPAVEQVVENVDVSPENTLNDEESEATVMFNGYNPYNNFGGVASSADYNQAPTDYNQAPVNEYSQPVANEFEQAPVAGFEQATVAGFEQPVAQVETTPVVEPVTEPAKDDFSDLDDGQGFVSSYSSTGSSASEIPAPAKKKKGLPAGAIIGIIAGALLILGGIGVGVFFVMSGMNSSSSNSNGKNNTEVVDTDGDDKDGENNQEPNNGGDVDKPDSESEPVPADPNAIWASYIETSGREYIGKLTAGEGIYVDNGEYVINDDGTVNVNTSGFDPICYGIGQAVDITQFSGQKVVIAIEYNIENYEELTDPYMQLFYTSIANEVFSEERSVICSVEKSGVVYFNISVTDSTDLRLDTPNYAMMNISSFKIATYTE